MTERKRRFFIYKSCLEAMMYLRMGRTVHFSMCLNMIRKKMALLCKCTSNTCNKRAPKPLQAFSSKIYLYYVAGNSWKQADYKILWNTSWFLVPSVDFIRRNTFIRCNYKNLIFSKFLGFVELFMKSTELKFGNVMYLNEKKRLPKFQVIHLIKKKLEAKNHHKILQFV